MSSIAPFVNEARGNLPGLRLTVRGRRVLLALLAGAVAVLFVAFASLATSASASNSSAQSSVAFVSVQQGESLWQVAESVAPHADPRETIAELMQFNRLGSSTVHPGQRIAIPDTLHR